MKASVTQENFNKALGLVSRIVGSRGSLPVLSNILVATDKNRLKLAATNLEIGVTCWLGAKVDEAGSITVPARLLSEYVASLPSTNLDLSLEKTSLQLQAEHYTSTLNGIAADEFPSIPTVEKGVTISLPAQDFKKALARVVLAASADDARPVLNGVYIYTEGNKLTLVATDSYRLAEQKFKLPAEPKTPIKAIVPARTLHELTRMVDEQEETIEMQAEENQVQFKFGEVELVSRLIDGQFPDYRQLIPKEAETTVTIKTADFINITKVAALFARENAGSITIAANTKSKTVSVRSLASQVGENSSEAAATIEGVDAEVALNSRYLLDGLGVMEAEELTFAVTGKINPCILRPDKDKDYLHIVMPLRS